MAFYITIPFGQFEIEMEVVRDVMPWEQHLMVICMMFIIIALLCFVYQVALYLMCFFGHLIKIISGYGKSLNIYKRFINRPKIQPECLAEDPDPEATSLTPSLTESAEKMKETAEEGRLTNRVQKPLFALPPGKLGSVYYKASINLCPRIRPSTLHDVKSVLLGKNFQQWISIIQLNADEIEILRTLVHPCGLKKSACPTMFTLSQMLYGNFGVNTCLPNRLQQRPTSCNGNSKTAQKPKNCKALQSMAAMNTAKNPSKTNAEESQQSLLGTMKSGLASVMKSQVTWAAICLCTVILLENKIRR